MVEPRERVIRSPTRPVMNMSNRNEGRRRNGPCSASTTMIAASRPVVFGSFAPLSRAPMLPEPMRPRWREGSQGRHERDEPEHPLDVANPEQRVGNQPDQRERDDQTDPADESTGVDGASDEQRIQREPQRCQPEREETTPGNPPTLTVARSEDERPDRERDEEHVGNTHVDRPERNGVVGEPEHDGCDEAGQAPLRALRDEEAEREERGHRQQCEAGRDPGRRRDAHPDRDRRHQHPDGEQQCAAGSGRAFSPRSARADR